MFKAWWLFAKGSTERYVSVNDDGESLVLVFIITLLNLRESLVLVPYISNGSEQE